jgi:hypothetical protein
MLCCHTACAESDDGVGRFRAFPFRCDDDTHAMIELNGEDPDVSRSASFGD